MQLFNIRQHIKQYGLMLLNEMSNPQRGYMTVQALLLGVLMYSIYHVNVLIIILNSIQI